MSYPCKDCIVREKVIKGLAIHADRRTDCGDCPYKNEIIAGGYCIGQLCEDALALIDTQYKLILELQKLIIIGTKMTNGSEVEMNETNTFEELIVMRSKGGDGTIYRQQPLVRCKDCKHRGTKMCYFYKLFGSEKFDDWFCADGKAKE